MPAPKNALVIWTTHDRIWVEMQTKYGPVEYDYPKTVASLQSILNVLPVIMHQRSQDAVPDAKGFTYLDKARAHDALKKAGII